MTFKEICSHVIIIINYDTYYLVFIPQVIHDIIILFYEELFTDK